MAKKSMIARETKRQRLVQKYAQKRAQFKQDLRNAGSIREVVTIHLMFYVKWHTNVYFLACVKQVGNITTQIICLGRGLYE